MNHAKHLKKVLKLNIKKLAAVNSDFVVNPHKDFTRKSVLSFEKIINIIISMETGSIKDELMKFFDHRLDTVSSSAFVQARSKILPEAFSQLFYMFNKSSKVEKLYKGYRLFAIDGSSILISHDMDDKDTYCHGGLETSKGYNSFHLVAVYDLLEHTYDDLIIQGSSKMNENGAFNELVNRYQNTENTIFIGDRGFESLNSFVHVMRTRNKFLIRVKDIHSKTSVAKSFDLPDEEFDVDVKRVLTRRYTNEIKEHPDIYKYMPKNQTFDFFGESKFYDFECRVIRFKISDDTYETIFTNLDREEFSSEEIKEIYNMRWGIETSFRELKYAVGMNAFHARKRNLIKQEIYARVILYNFCERIIRNIQVRQTNRKYKYQINFTRAIHYLRTFLKKKGNKLPDVVSLIAKEILPIRPGRTDPRKVKPKSVVCFNYRYD